MNTDDSWHWLTGRISPESFQLFRVIENPSVNEMIAAAAGAILIIGLVVVVSLITYYRWWRTLWFEWLTSTDHKRIGIMYIVLSLVMLTRGVIEGFVMIAQHALGLDGGFLAGNHFAQLFTTHGTIMIFFVAMPFIAGVINYVMPLQIGARDVSFPVLNQISLALTAAGATLVMISLAVGDYSTGGWQGTPPYTGRAFNPGPGPDYWIWSVGIAGIGTTLSGINFAVTIYKERAPGMGLFRMPLFTWTVLCTAIIMIFAMPPLTVATATLALDRYLDFHFFTNDLGGNMMNYINLFWLFGHPEVYLLVLPAYGIYSEIVATFSGKRLYGYASLVYATMVIAVLSFAVWLHHFFTMGQSPNVNIAFGIASMLIAVPTGVKIYDWIATMFRGRIRFTVPVIYLTGFFMLFTIGGVTGVMLANPTISFQVHNTLFLVAHFHNVIIPGVLFGLLAALNYWFPKVFGYRLNEKWGRAAALLWIAGFAFTFLPLYVVGLMGMPRRSVTYTDPLFEPVFMVSLVGGTLIFAALLTLLVQLWVSVRDRAQTRVPLGDPWNGRTLEWSTPSPPPEYNFAVLPRVTARDGFAELKSTGRAYLHPDHYEDIAVPRNTPIGMIYMIALTILGMALTWYIWWLVVLSAAVLPLVLIVRSFFSDQEIVIPAAEVEREHRDWLDAIGRVQGITRDRETTSDNLGLAAMEPAP
ncbi:cbb3-type cytochrome c oxidase subunit I [Microbulbifer sp. TYP-18]|uniref:cbb3-type cytochrome c oxidase subunit I n=1 Tax=Microbulbifer sp. TYP-18 TaxID=3230024 RepID=UPI0034C6797C